MATNYDGLTRNVWPGTWSTGTNSPIVLDTEVRGTLQSISGDSGDRLTDIPGARIQEGMLVYVKNGYTSGLTTYTADKYYTYKLQGGEVRSNVTGAVPNADANWSLFSVGGGAGYTGSQGIQGEIGFTGSKGADGTIGVDGYTGSQGEIGFTGSKGADGTIGVDGYTGSQGEIGFTGSQGDIGYAGSEGNLDITTSNNPPLSAELGDIWIDELTGVQYFYYNDGNSNQWVEFSNTGFSGYTGSQGNIGYTGSQGDIGFTGSQGVIGYTGSEGDIGYTGSQGDVGSQGVIGYTGSEGDIGYTGSQGDVGSQGVIGYTGSQGSQGNIGYTGSQGSIGYTGSKGDIGYTGSLGNIGYTGSQGSSTLSGLTDVSSASLTVDQIYLPAITRLNVTANGSSAYRFDQYGVTDNPTLYAISGTTIAFNLQQGVSHPFLIRYSSANYNTGLVHVSTTGIVTTESSAQGKTSGTLYWKIPHNINGNYGYLCSNHGSMIGIITIKDISVI
jgi:plastocyanin